jgi:hypothetical protein
MLITNPMVIAYNNVECFWVEAQSNRHVLILVNSNMK